MRIIGIDPATRSVGYAVVDANDENFSLLDGGVFNIDSDFRLSQIIELYRFTKNLIKNFVPDVIVVEESFYGKNVRTLVRLAEMRTSILLAAAEESVDIVEYSPREIKLAITGNGNASKERVSYIVSSMVGVDMCERFDFSDAIATALCFILRGRR